MWILLENILELQLKLQHKEKLLNGGTVSLLLALETEDVLRVWDEYYGLQASVRGHFYSGGLIGCAAGVHSMTHESEDMIFLKYLYIPVKYALFPLSLTTIFSLLFCASGMS